jgi:PPOX class probable F420-dependent enzyme
VTGKTNGQGFHPRLAELASGDNFAVLTTLMPDGHPQTQVMWVDADDDYLLYNTEVNRQKLRNVERDPSMTLTIWDKEDSYNFVDPQARADREHGRGERQTPPHGQNKPARRGGGKRGRPEG